MKCRGQVIGSSALAKSDLAAETMSALRALSDPLWCPHGLHDVSTA